MSCPAAETEARALLTAGQVPVCRCADGAAHDAAVGALARDGVWAGWGWPSGFIVGVLVAVTAGRVARRWV